jgi:hypothetical protein
MTASLEMQSSNTTAGACIKLRQRRPCRRGAAGLRLQKECRITGIRPPDTLVTATPSGQQPPMSMKAADVSSSPQPTKATKVTKSHLLPTSPPRLRLRPAPFEKPSDISEKCGSRQLVGLQKKNGQLTTLYSATASCWPHAAKPWGAHRLCP